jgi:glutaminyl-tRNA synthetase
MSQLENPEATTSNFLHEIVTADLQSGKYSSAHTRFPPEPNGYLHIGHAKSICLNFGIKTKFAGKCNLRFDDTNPAKEDVEYVESIQNDIRWLGFEWDNLFNASDYFDLFYDYAEKLIQEGKAYVCPLRDEEIREFRGTVKMPGKESPGRSHSVEQNLDLFRRMKAGEFEDGMYTLRARIDMAHANMKMRDPLMYRIRHQHHHATGDKWCIYPMYDWAHPLSDAIEGITHSICTLEFENNRALYDWFIDAVGLWPERPYQYEFARLNLNYTVMSKRKLLQLVQENRVDGWDDPRMPTISGLRRRGFTPESIREFAERIGVSRSDNTVDVGLLEFCVRDHLNKVATRRMAVLRPLKVVISNYPEGQVEMFPVMNNPENLSEGERLVPFSREIWVEREDFMEEAAKKWFRLAPGQEVRLRGAYYITCTDVIKDEEGQIVALHCTYDPESKGGGTPDNRRVKGTIHWVSVPHAKTAEVRLYDRLFCGENPEDVPEDQSFLDNLNPQSLEILSDCKIEPSLAEMEPGQRVQFERLGYFCVDTKYSQPGAPVFNRTVGLKDSWAKESAKV